VPDQGGFAFRCVRRNHAGSRVFRAVKAGR
jgi:hypothetical protein